jgi:anti-anti-sigma factor
MTGLANLEIDEGTEGRVVRIQGEIDISNAHEISAVVETAMPNGAETLLIDLTGTTFLDSAGVQLLFQLAQRLRTRRQQLKLIVPEDAPIRAVLELTGLQRIVPMEGLQPG